MLGWYHLQARIVTDQLHFHHADAEEDGLSGVEIEFRSIEEAGPGEEEGNQSSDASTETGRVQAQAARRPPPARIQGEFGAIQVQPSYSG